MTQSTTSWKSIGSIAAVLVGSVIMLFGLVIFAVAVSLLVQGHFLSGHAPGLLVLVQGAVVFLLGRWLFKLGLKLQQSLQGAKQQVGS